MPRDLRILPRLAVVIPLPTELTTPPVTKMNFGMDPAINVAPKMLRAGGQGRQRTFVLQGWQGTGNREPGTGNGDAERGTGDCPWPSVTAPTALGRPGG